MSELSKFLVAAFCGTLVSVWGCGTEEDDETRRTALVFVERDVRQSRNHLVNAAAHPLSSKNRQLDAILMMQSMPTGIVYLAAPEDDIFFEPNGDPSCRPRTTRGVGSGILTSTTRLATAHHVVWPFEEPDFQVRFGGDGSNNPATLGGRFITDQPAEMWDASFPVFNGSFENFLVANRLVQLGLDNWTAPNMDQLSVRDNLRRWRLEIDGRDLVAGDPANFEHQGFVSLQGLPAEIRGEDVAFLAAVGPVTFNVDDFDRLPSGAFPLSNPGMFFDAVSSGSISADDSSAIDGSTPLIALHSPLYPNADSVQHGQVISRSGSFRGAATASTSFCLDGDVRRFTHTNLVSTTLDAIASSSGGGVLGCPSAAGQTLDRERVACAFTIDGNPAPEQQHIGTPRAHGLITSLLVPNVGEAERQRVWSDAVVNQDDYSTDVTLWSERAETWTERDRGNPADPFNPVIERLPGEQSPPCTGMQQVDPLVECSTDAECELGQLCQEHTCHECLSWSTDAQKSYFGAPPVLQFSFESPLESAEGQEVFETGGYSFPDPTNPRSRRQEVRCGSLMRNVDRKAMDAPSCNVDEDCSFVSGGGVPCNGATGKCAVPAYYGAGVVIGFRGTATQWTEPDQMTIGGLQPVCAPWTSVPWSQNWRFLMSLGPTLPPEKDSRGVGPGAGILPLWRKITLQYENRADTLGTGEVVWPHSMKLCPPNYFVVDVKVRPSARRNRQGKIFGITSLVCAAGLGNPEHGTTIEVPLHHGEPWAMSPGLDVSLSQMIGNPQDRGDSVLIEGCDANQAWSGFRTRHNANGELIGLWPNCIPRPGSRSGTSTQRMALTADTYVLKNQSSNFGTDSSMLVGGGRDARSLININLDEVAQAVAGGTITRVVLEFPFAPEADEELSVRLHRMTQEWTELGATWDCASQQSDGSCSATWNMFEHPGQPNPDAPGRNRNFPANPWIEEATATAVIDGTAPAFQVDVTADVEAMIASGTNYGWILISDSLPNVDTSLRTRETGNGPELIVGFDPALPAPTLELSPNDVFLQVSEGLGFGTPAPATSWFVNGIAGGNETVGRVSTTGVYTAPTAPPTPATVEVAALTSTGEVAAAQVTIPRRTVDPSVGEVRHRFFGADAGDGAGHGFVAPRTSIASGDLSADGVDDIVIGVPGGDSVGNTLANAGEVGIYFGSAALGSDIDMQTDSPDVIIWGDGLAGRFLGAALAIADLDGDGADDLVVSETDPAAAGFVHVFFGPFISSQSINLLTENADLTLWSSLDPGFGWRLGAGDVDADGVADLVVEARLADGPGGTRPDAGALYVVSGGVGLRTAGVLDLSTQAPRSTIYMPTVQNAPAGAPPAAAAYAKRLEGVPLAVGDVTNDGVADIVVGRNSAEDFGGSAGAGVAFVVFGGATLPQVVDLAMGEADTVLVGQASVDMFGFSTSISDVTGDGVGDLIATAPGLDGGGRSDAGGAWIVPGPLASGTFQVAAGGLGAIRVIGPRDRGFAGYVVGVVQMDTDPLVEIAFSGCIDGTGSDSSCGPASGRELAGEVYVFDLASAASVVDLRHTPMDLIAFGSDPFDRFGASLYRANTDGLVPDELVVGAPEADGPNEQRNMAGEVLVISGTP